MKNTNKFWKMHEKTELNLIGWTGASLLVIFYVLNIFGVISAQNLWYQLGNIVGGGLLIFFAIKLKVWPNLLTNSVWLVAALIALVTLIVSGK